MYIDKLGRLATHCGGGAGVPLIRFMDRFAKCYGTHKILGREFTTAVVDLHVSDVEPITWTRVALILANLASDKVSDGIAKLLVASDIEKIKSKTNKPKAIDLNACLKKAYNIVESMRNCGRIDMEQADELVGLFFIRSVLHLVGKGKQGPEGICYENQAEIITKFVSEASKMAGDGKEIDPDKTWLLSSVPSEGASIDSGTQPIVLSDADLRDPVRIMESKGFQKGTNVIEKSVGASSGLYRVTGISDTISLEQVTAFQEASFTVEVDLDKFIKDWGTFKGKVPIAVPTEICPCPAQHVSIKSDMLRFEVFSGLRDFEQTNQPNKLLQYGMNPHVVVARESISANKLVLTPFSDLQRIKVDESPSAVAVKVGGERMFVSAPIRATDESKITDKHVLWVPFWWVKETDKEDEANMKLIACKHQNISFKVFRNTSALKQFDRLLYYKSKEQHAALAGAKKIKLGHPTTAASAKGKAEAKAAPKTR